jgi:zinc/manganese transport system permease protein
MALHMAISMMLIPTARPRMKSHRMFEYDFMRNAFAAATVVAIVSGVVGYFLVLRGQTFAGHALAHVGFTGATGAVLVGIAPLWGLVTMTVAAGVLMGLMGERLAQRDVAIGLVLAFALALGLLFLHFFTSFATHATALLFGNVLAVDPATIVALIVLGGLCLGTLALISRPLLFASLQPELAEAKGVSLRLYGVLFLAIVALATAECAQIVGVLLVFALMVGPAAAAQKIVNGVAAGVMLSAILALAEAWGGITLAYYTDWPTSFWITALSTLIYVLAAVPRQIRVGALSRQTQASGR